VATAEMLLSGRGFGFFNGGVPFLSFVFDLFFSFFTGVSYLF
jgi:hypothetical protein